MLRNVLLALVSLALLRAEQVRISVLATTDLHGNIFPVDYYTARPANRGLAKLATLVKAARAENPNSVLIDCGDTIQGSPLEYVYQSFVSTGRLPLKLRFEGSPLESDPMMLAMNHLAFDAMVLGNHEFNFGLRNLRRARSSAGFPWLSANTLASGDAQPFDPHLVKTVAGVKIAIIGVTTPSVPIWEKPQNYAGYRFESARNAVERSLAALRLEKPDLVVVAAHAGLDTTEENPMRGVAESVPGIDVIVFGHTHQEVPSRTVNGVLVMQPKNWGMSLGRADFTLEREPGAPWRIVAKTSRLVPVTASVPADEKILTLGKPYHDLAESYLNTEVARVDRDLDAALGRVEDIALVDAVHAVQLHYTGADVSFTALFNPRVQVSKGPVTVRQIAALYLYENELYAIEGNGKMVKDALENAAHYFLSCSGDSCSQAPLINKSVLGFNFDMAQGVTYDIDLTRKEGDRIRNLTWKSSPLEPDRKLRIAINNYRAGGSAGYEMFRDAKVLWRSSQDIRQLMIDYYSGRRTLPANPDNNWRIVPPEALANLQRQARAEATRSQTQ